MARAKQHSTQQGRPQTWETNTRSTPVSHEQTIRRQNVSVVTSSFGGKLVPLKAIGLHREDSVINSLLTLNLQMAETASMLLNPVRIAAAAYLVPKLAFDRFPDMGTIDRSWNGQEEIDGSVVPWFNPWTLPAGGIKDNHPILQTLGLHANSQDTYNTDYVEAYNAIWNFAAKNRSVSLTERDKADASLGPAFWANTQMKHVVPTFDDAMIEGVVPINFVGDSNQIPVVKRAISNSITFQRNDNDNPVGAGGAQFNSGGKLVTDGGQTTNFDPGNSLYAELQENQIQLTLANIDLARETAAWARLRTQYQGKSEDWMMDQLLSGVRLNDEGMKQPILLDTQEVNVGMAQRYATDSGNLTKSVTDGRTSLQLRIRTPKVDCGGVVMVVAQALPEQIYERQRDYYFAASSPADMPNRTRDELDPQPVSLLTNAEVDESHTLPSDLFGYAPLNHQWTGGPPNVGGRYYRQDPNEVWTEDRNRIWDTGVVDPQLGPDFYVSTSLQHEVFEDSQQDNFEWWLGGNVTVRGNTYFGPQLREATDDYQKVLDQVDTTRIDPNE